VEDTGRVVHSLTREHSLRWLGPFYLEAASAQHAFAFSFPVYENTASFCAT
jgi:hypothetical protein